MSLYWQQEDRFVCSSNFAARDHINKKKGLSHTGGHVTPSLGYSTACQRHSVPRILTFIAWWFIQIDTTKCHFHDPHFTLSYLEKKGQFRVIFLVSGFTQPVFSKERNILAHLVYHLSTAHPCTSQGDQVGRLIPSHHKGEPTHPPLYSSPQQTPIAHLSGQNCFYRYQKTSSYKQPSLKLQA